MREYIEDWLRRALIKITEPEQDETVAAIMPPRPQKALTKEAPPSKWGSEKKFHYSESSSNVSPLLVITLLQSFFTLPLISHLFMKLGLIFIVLLLSSRSFHFMVRGSLSPILLEGKTKTLV